MCNFTSDNNHNIKMIKTLLLLFVLINISLFSSPVLSKNVTPDQNNRKKFKKTMKMIDKGKFRHAESNLLELWKTDTANLDYNYELALLYFYDLKMSEKAHKYFLKVKNIVGEQIDDYPELHYYLGQTYHFNGDFENAISEYSQCNEKELQIKDEIAGKLDREIAACKFAMTLKERPDVRIRNLGNRINTWFAEYVPVPVMQDSMLLFTSIRPPVMSTHYGFEGPVYYERIFISRRSGKKYSFAEVSSNFPEFNGLNMKPRKHNAVVGMNYEGNEMLLYRKNKLWTTVFVDGKWQKPVKIQKEINFSFYQPHVSMTKDGKTLYFSSWSKKTGFGNLDIYMCSKDDKGNWGHAINLGFVINTAFNEDSPEITPDGKTLYFSSQGHKGIGGFDIFRSDFVNGNWNEPKNMGIPVNSPGDDIFFRFAKDGRIAYFSSYRKDGLGNMDIYEAEFFPLFFRCDDKTQQELALTVMGIDLTDTVTVGEPVVLKPYNPRSDTYHFNDCVWRIDTTLFDYQPEVSHTFLKAGTIPVILEANVVHNETKETETYCLSKTFEVMTAEQILANNTKTQPADTATQSIDTTVIAAVNNVISDTSATVIAAVNETVSSNTTTPVNIPELQNVYFDFNRADVNSVAAGILDQNIAMLKTGSELKIIITAHADSQGDAAYNKILSERRAKSVYDYITSKGIDKSRISETKGMGEDVPPAVNSETPVNTIKYYKLSRRCEITVTGSVSRLK